MLTIRVCSSLPLAGGAIVRTEKVDLYVHPSFNIAMLRNSDTLLRVLCCNFVGIHSCVPVEVDKEGGDFRVLPVRLPYELELYSIYRSIGAMGVYGASFG